jgi:hypothetical protein
MTRTRTRIRARAAAARHLNRTAHWTNQASRRLHHIAQHLDRLSLHHSLINLRQQRTLQGATPHQHHIYPNHLHTNITSSITTAYEPTILDHIHNQDT